MSCLRRSRYSGISERSFFDEVTADDEVKLQVDPDSLRDSNDKEGRQRIDFYTLSVGDREYITYEEYAEAEAQSTQFGWSIALLFFALASIFAVWIAVAYAICRKNIGEYDR